MIERQQCAKHYSSAEKRFLHSMIISFFSREFPKTFGPIIINRIAQEIIDLVEKHLPLRNHLQPGQCVWNVVSKKTRPDSPNCIFVPVILTLIDKSDIEQLANGIPMTTIAKNSIARITKEAYEQGGLLSMRDIGLLVWRHNASISQMRKKWEEKNNSTLPHVGSYQDFGSCMSHKTIIIKKVVIEKKDSVKVANETKHSQKAVDRYLKDFYKVKTCYQVSSDIDFICKATGQSRYLVKQYLDILKECEDDKKIA